MKRITIILLVFCATCGCRAQQSSEREERMNAHCLDYVEWRITRYADSLNFWRPGNRLPEFVFDKRFDLKYTFTNTDCFREGKPFSSRKYIIDRVYNAAALKYLIDIKDSRLDSVFIPTEAQLNGEGLEIKDFYQRFPYRTRSTRNLAEKRLKFLQEMDKK